MKKEDLEKLEKIQEELNVLKQKIEKQDDFNYPIYCKSKTSSLVVKFTGLKDGIVVINNNTHSVGYEISSWQTHTNTEYWQKLEVCPKTGFFDGQAVYCWNNSYTHMRFIKFYDTKNNCTFTYEGNRGGCLYKNYEPYQGDYLPWMLEAFKTLKR